MFKANELGIFIIIEDIEKDLIDLENKLNNKKFFEKETDFYLYDQYKKYYKQVYEIVDKHGHNLYLIKKEKNKKRLKTYIISKKVRSGQTIKKDGDVLLLGDLASGAQIKATGNVYVIGKAYGFIHAGCNGDKTAMILGLKLASSLLQIADVMAKNDEQIDSEYPERVYLDSDQHMIVEEINSVENVNKQFKEEWDNQEKEKKQSKLSKFFRLGRS